MTAIAVCLYQRLLSDIRLAAFCMRRSVVEPVTQTQTHKVGAVVGRLDIEITDVSVSQRQTHTLFQIRNTHAHFICELEQGGFSLVPNRVA
jgi:hypothetical protein